MAPGDGDRSDTALDGVDIGALLAAALDKPPPPDLADRVRSRLALVETVSEFARLFGAVPVEAAGEAVLFEPDEDDAADEEDEDA